MILVSDQPSNTLDARVNQPHAFLNSFELPAALEARGPSEAYGVRRDGVRLEVASGDLGIVHTSFHAIADFLRAGDLLVANDSGTIPAAISGTLAGVPVRLHVSTPVPESDLRLVELRTPTGFTSAPYEGTPQSDTILLPSAGIARLRMPQERDPHSRLWQTALALPGNLNSYLNTWGEPIRYSYSERPWPIGCYQTIFAKRPGSSEMPSAGRPFSRSVLRRLRMKGIRVCSITLHTGVASMEQHELPFAEPYVVSKSTADLVNQTKATGGRVIAIGTTVVRALHTVSNDAGFVHAGRGFTDVIIEPSTKVSSVQGLVTGWHEPKATHLMMLEAVAGADLLALSYSEALLNGYRWHEFGDSHLILP